MPFPVAVVTPEANLLEGEANALVLRSSGGDFTVLTGHTPLVTDIVPGAVRIEGADGVIVLAVHGGYLQVEPAGGRATVLAGVAEKAGEIDVPRATAAKAAAESRLAELGRGEADSTELALAEAALRRAVVRLEVAGAA